MLKIKLPIAIAAALCFPISAQATVSFTSSQTYCKSSGCTFIASDPTVSNAAVTAFSTTGNSNTTFQTATIGYWNGSGLGIYSQKDNSYSPNHAIDNYNGVDVAQFSFTEEITLKSVTIGWPDTTGSYDTDISVLAYTGVGSPVSFLGKTVAQLLSSGWSFIGHYANLVADTAKAINNDDVSSSYWLVSAYNSAFGSSSGISGLNSSNDYFKIQSLGGEKTTTPPDTIPGVPEPSGLLMLIFGFLGWKLVNRSQQNVNNRQLAA